MIMTLYFLFFLFNIQICNCCQTFFGKMKIELFSILVYAQLCVSKKGFALQAKSDHYFPNDKFCKFSRTPYKNVRFRFTWSVSKGYSPVLFEQENNPNNHWKKKKILTFEGVLLDNLVQKCIFVELFAATPHLSESLFP